MVPFSVLFVQRFLLQYLIKVKEIDINEVEKLASSVNVFFFIDSSWQQIQPLTRISDRLLHPESFQLLCILVYSLVLNMHYFVHTVLPGNVGCSVREQQEPTAPYRQGCLEVMEAGRLQQVISQVCITPVFPRNMI